MLVFLNWGTYHSSGNWRHCVDIDDCFFVCWETFNWWKDSHLYRFWQWKDSHKNEFRSYYIVCLFSVSFYFVSFSFPFGTCKSSGMQQLLIFLDVNCWKSLFLYGITTCHVIHVIKWDGPFQWYDTKIKKCIHLFIQSFTQCLKAGLNCERVNKQFNSAQVSLSVSPKIQNRND